MPSPSRLLPCLVLLGLSLAARAQPPAPSSVRVGGSSSVLPLTRIMQAGFRQQSRTLSLTLTATSTARGFRELCAGQVDVVGASRPILAPELAKCAAAGQRFVEVRIAFDGVAVVAHRDAAWAASMTVAELRRAWAREAQGRVLRWSDVRKGWPDTPLKLVAPDTGSGTRDFFLEALGLPADAPGRPGLRADVVKVESGDEMLRRVALQPGALGFVSVSHLEDHRGAVHVVAVDDEDARTGAGAVLPDEAAVSGGTYQPLSRPLLLYVSAQSLEREGVVSFVRFYLAHVQRVAGKVGFAPMPERLHRLAQARFEARRLGSLLSGRAAGVSVEELLRREEQGAQQGR